MDGLRYTAWLSGAQAVPPVTTIGTASAILSFDQTCSILRVSLTVNYLNNVTAVELRLGMPGLAGPAVLLLLGPLRVPADFGPGALLVSRAFTEADLVGPLACMGLPMLAPLLLSGHAYLSIPTIHHPTGEIQGAVVPMLAANE